MSLFNCWPALFVLHTDYHSKSAPNGRQLNKWLSKKSTVKSLDYVAALKFRRFVTNRLFFCRRTFRLDIQPVSMFSPPPGLGTDWPTPGHSTPFEAPTCGAPVPRVQPNFKRLLLQLIIDFIITRLAYQSILLHN